MDFGHSVNSNLSENCVCLNCGFANVYKKDRFLLTRVNKDEFIGIF